MSFRDIVGRMFGASVETRQRPLTPNTVFSGPDRLIGNQVPLGEQQSMRVSAVYACVRLISEAIASLPVDCYVRDGSARREAQVRPKWLDTPNESDLWLDIASGLVVSLLLRGNAYLFVQRGPLGTIDSVYVLDPARVAPQYVKDSDGRTVLRYSLDGSEPTYTARDVVHIPAMRLPGQLCGMSPLEAAEASALVAHHADVHTASLLKNGATPAAIIQVPGSLADQGITQLKEAWNDVHKGPSNAGRMGVLTEGAQFKQLALSSTDVELLETRRYSVDDVARVFGIPPHLVGSVTRSTSWGAGITEQSAGFLRYTLQPWLTRLESRLTALVQTENTSAFIRFQTAALLRPTVTQRYAAYATAIQNGWMTTDEVRALEDLPPRGERVLRVG